MMPYSGSYEDTYFDGDDDPYGYEDDYEDDYAEVEGDQEWTDWYFKLMDCSD